MSLTLRFANSGASLAKAPSSVVQTGVKSAGWENRTAQLSPINLFHHQPFIVSQEVILERGGRNS